MFFIDLLSVITTSYLLFCCENLNQLLVVIPFVIGFFLRNLIYVYICLILVWTFFYLKKPALLSFLPVAFNVVLVFLFRDILINRPGFFVSEHYILEFLFLSFGMLVLSIYYDAKLWGTTVLLVPQYYVIARVFHLYYLKFHINSYTVVFLWSVVFLLAILHLLYSFRYLRRYFWFCISALFVFQLSPYVIAPILGFFTERVSSLKYKRFLWGVAILFTLEGIKSCYLH